MNYIKEMGDHYAVVALGGGVIATITRAGGTGNDGMWRLDFLNGRLGLSYVPLASAMQEALKRDA